MADRHVTETLAACAVLLALIVAGATVLRHLASDSTATMEFAWQ